jgi:hypothetical protein
VVSSVLYIVFASKACNTAWPIKDTLKITLASVVMGIIVFLLQLQLKNAAVSLVILVPLGVVIQFIGLARLGVVRQEDVNILRRIQESLPARFKKSYGLIIRMVEKMTTMRITRENKA